MAWTNFIINLDKLMMKLIFGNLVGLWFYFFTGTFSKSKWRDEVKRGDRHGSRHYTFQRSLKPIKLVCLLFYIDVLIVIHLTRYHNWIWTVHICEYHICGVIVLAASDVNGGFETRLCQIKDYKISICWLTTKYTVLRSKSPHRLAQNQVKVSEWSNMSTRRLLF